VRITDLNEIERRSRNGSRIGQDIPQGSRGKNASRNGADHGRSGPAHAAKKAPAVNAIAAGVVKNNIIVFHMNGSCFWGLDFEMKKADHGLPHDLLAAGLIYSMNKKLLFGNKTG
jgi:hypothetical protein